MQQIKNIALVLEGGGFRGMYTAGVLEAMLGEQLFFDYLIGVSAGAAYGVSYVSRQSGRNLAVNNYVSDPRYCGWGNMFKYGTYFNWEFVYHTIPASLLPFDYKQFAASSSRIKIVVSNINTGQPEYKEMEGDCPLQFRDMLTATSALPFISKPQKINDSLYLDGGLVDSIPVHKAFSDGCNRAVVVLTRPKDYRKKPMKNNMILRFFYRKYPKVIDMLLNRADMYNKTLDELEELEKMGKVFVIRPLENLPVARLDNNPANLEIAYHNALKQMDEVMPRLLKWINN